MLIDCYEREDVFAQVPELAAEIDPVLKHLDTLLDDAELYRASCEPISANGIAGRWCMGDARPRWRCCCVCSSSNTSTSGAIKNWKDGSRIAWCCVGSAGWPSMWCPMPVRSGAGSRRCSRKRYMRSTI